MKDGCAECKGVSDSKASVGVQVQVSVCHCEKEASCIGDSASEVDGCSGSGRTAVQSARASVTVR